jgi:probable addiction module antidote protein
MRKKIIVNQNIGISLNDLKTLAMKKGGIANLALKTGLSRETLYKTLSYEGNPTLKTLNLIVTALGYELVIEVI